jgi:NLR family CARD domain-containing protein 3
MKRLTAYPALREHLDKLQSKVFVLSSDADVTPIEVMESELEIAADAAVERIKKSKFTSKGDKDTVISLYEEYARNTVGALTKTLGSLQMLASHSATAAPAEPLPQVDAPAASSLLLAEGQPLLLLSWQGSGSGPGGRPRFGVVDATGGRVAAAVTGEDDAELAYDRCSQAVLPWRQPAVGWDAAFVSDARALRDLAEPARRLAEDARRMESESALRAVGEQAREIADGAARCQTIAHAAREAGGAVRSCVDAAVALFSQGDPKQLEAAFKKVRAAVERLQPEAMVTAALRSSGASGARRYAAGQPLTVRTASGWRDADVATTGADGLCHLLEFEGSGKPPATLTLHPWNHAPRELPHAAYEAMRAWWARWLGVQQARIADALTGKRLDALQQCVAINVTGGAAETQASTIRDAHSLTAWLLAQHSVQLEGSPTEGPLAALLTAGPASGKTTLLSQVVMVALQDERAELVPILVKVQVLQRRLLEAPDAFAGAWNYIDAFLRLEHEASRPALYRMLRQAMMARRALLLLDGLDEAGATRDDIERHVVDVLAPQGHVLLCTSRPAGVVEARFAAFRRLALAPLSEAQQERALEQRLGAERAAALLTYVRDVMPRDDTGQKVTSNPLMLSMVASVYELRQGVGMPATVAELYATASDAMLARGGVTTPELTRLLQRIFFEAHVLQRRLIEDRQLDEAALGLEAPEALAKIRAEAVAKMPFEAVNSRAEMGHYVEVTKEGEHKGKRGVITTDDEYDSQGDKESQPYKVTFADGTERNWLAPDDLGSSGLNEMAFLQRAMDASASKAAVRAACEACLSEALREALRTVRERVLVDALPLLSLWQSEPLQLQSSHLSFQEYFAAIALCDEGTKLSLSGTLPWQWSAWWANAVKLGAEIPGDRFGRGLLRAAGVMGDTLDLSQKLGGDRPTVRRVLAAVVASAGELLTLDLSQNELDAEDARALAPALTKTTLARVDVRRNKIAADGAALLSAAVLGNLDIEIFNEIPIKKMRANLLTELDLDGKDFGVEGGMVVAGLIPVMGGLTSINLRGNQLCGIWNDGLGTQLGTYTAEGIIAIANALRVNGGLTSLGLSSNQLCGLDRDGHGTYTAEGITAIADALRVNGGLTSLDLSSNQLCGLGRYYGRGTYTAEGITAIADALRVNGALTKLSLAQNKLEEEGTKAICEALEQNTTLKELGISGDGFFGHSNIGGSAGAKHVAKMLGVNGALTVTNLLGNKLDEKSAKMLAEVAKQKGISLCGIRRDQTTADFRNQGLEPPDAILLASDLSQAVVTGGLTSLNLRFNQLCGLDYFGKGTYTAEGITAIADALRVNGGLTALDLSSNELKDEGVSAVCEAIQSNKETKLSTLNFKHNGIGPVGAKSVAAMVAVTGVLTNMRYVADQSAFLHAACAAKERFPRISSLLLFAT